MIIPNHVLTYNFGFSIKCVNGVREPHERELTQWELNMLGWFLTRKREKELNIDYPVQH